MFKENANPVGEPHRIEEVENKVQFYCRLWDSRNETRSMWLPKVSMSAVTNFLLMALDDFVMAVSTAVISGPDKKATVLEAVSRLYDYTVAEALPIWLVPFAGAIKQYIVYILVSSAIDWMVAKYRNGSWKSAQSAMDRVLMLADQRMVLCKSSCRNGRQK
jgi:hypothetical protein